MKQSFMVNISIKDRDGRVVGEQALGARRPVAEPVEGGNVKHRRSQDVVHVRVPTTQASVLHVPGALSILPTLGACIATGGAR